MPPSLSCREWADKYRFLSRESSAQPGKYLSAVCPYQREPMEAVNDGSVYAIVLRWAAQLGKTEILSNIVGYFMEADPAPILMVQPTVELGKAWSKERLAPMLRDTPVLRDLVQSPRSRDSENTILHKTFVGGNIAIVGANAPTGLAGRPRRVILLDEIDRYPPSAGSEGDPCALAEKRAESFWNAVLVKTSTPTIKGSSRVDVAWAESDQRQWWCPCPRCGEFQVLSWSQVQWPKGEPEWAAYICLHCKIALTDEDRRAMVLRGQWRPQHPGRRVRGYHLTGIATLFRPRRGFRSRLHQMAVEFLSAQAGGALKLRVWINTFLAESWEEEAERVAHGELMKRAEGYGPKLPLGVLVLTAGVDVQGDRLECEVVGWGLGEESWGVQYAVIPGKPDDPMTWTKLDELLLKVWPREDGVNLRVAAAGVDYGAFTDFVLKYTKRHFARAVLGVKGSPTPGAPVISAVRRNNRFKSATMTVGTDQAKSLLYARIKIGEPGPGYLHFPGVASGYDEPYYSALTAEELRVSFRRGFAIREWHKIKARNEALDARIYAYAMLRFLNPNWTRLMEGMAHRQTPVSGSALQTQAESRPVTGRPRPPAQPQPQAPQPKGRYAIRPVGYRRGFSGGWRKF